MDGKPTSFSRGTVYGNLTTVGLGDMFNDGKPQTGSAKLPTAGLIDPVKPFEQPG